MKKIIMYKLLAIAFLILYVPNASAGSSNVYSGSGDGVIFHNGVSTWDGVHDASSGADEWPSLTFSYVNSRYEYSNAKWGNGRAFLPFDTAFLPDNAEVQSAILHLMPKSRVTIDDDQYTYIQPTGPSSQANFTTLVEDDYDQCSNVDNPELWSDTTVDYDDTWSDGTYVEFSFNSTGTAGVSLDDYTGVCMRSGFDIEDVAPSTAASGENEWRYYAEEQSGTSKDPYLEINYSVPPTPPEELYAEGAMAPMNVTDTTPEFSAVFNDPDGDSGTHYKIQVSTSQDSWSTTVWDSGKTALGSSVSDGARSENISYGGSALATDGTTYYWRIKFWDADGVEGVWSGGHYFTMD